MVRDNQGNFRNVTPVWTNVYSCGFLLTFKECLKLAKVYTKQYVDDPLAYQGMMFTMLTGAGILQTDNIPIMTLHFYAPIYYLLTICDREPKREKEALKTLEEHIKQFDRLYGRNNR